MTYRKHIIGMRTDLSGEEGDGLIDRDELTDRPRAAGPLPFGLEPEPAAVHPLHAVDRELLPASQDRLAVVRGTGSCCISARPACRPSPRPPRLLAAHRPARSPSGRWPGRTASRTDHRPPPRLPTNPACPILLVVRSSSLPRPHPPLRPFQISHSRFRSCPTCIECRKLLSDNRFVFVNSVTPVTQSWW